MRMNIRYNFGNVIVSAVPYDSENELRTRIRHAERAIMLETEHDAPSVFLLLEGRCPGAREISECGLLCAPVGVIPQLAPHPAGQLCWVGFDSYATLISFAEPRCVATNRLDGLFWDFVPQPGGLVVVVHELGVVCLDSQANPAWKMVGSDMLERYRLAKGRIVCTYVDGQSQSHELIRD